MVAPIIAAAGIGAAGSLIGGLLGASAQDEATQAALEAQLAQLEFNREVFDEVMRRFDKGERIDRREMDRLKTDLLPYSIGGQNAQQALLYEMGLLDRAPMMRDPNAVLDRRRALEGDNAFQRLSDSEVYRRSDGSFGYTSRNPLRIETVENGIAPGQPGGPQIVSSRDGGGQQIVNPPGAPQMDTTFRVGPREFDTRREARDFLTEREAARGGPTFDTRGEAARALTRETRQAKRNALADVGPIGTRYQGYEVSPEARLRMDEGRQAIQGSAAAGGRLLSGDTINAIVSDHDAVVQADRGNHLARLAGLSGSGMNAITGLPLGQAGAGAGQYANLAFTGAQPISAGMGNLGTINSQGAANIGSIWQNALGQAAGFAGYGLGGYFNQRGPY